MIYSIIVGIIVLICILLTIVVLLQSGQGQGLAGGLAASSGLGGTPMGARRTADLLSKSTTVLGTAFLVLCVLANFFIYSNQPNESAVQQNASGPQPTNTQGPVETQPAVPQQQTPTPQQQQPTQPPADQSGGGYGGGKP
jgi:preprotein translocase subunit SecG